MFLPIARRAATTGIATAKSAESTTGIAAGIISPESAARSATPTAATAAAHHTSEQKARQESAASPAAEERQHHHHPNGQKRPGNRLARWLRPDLPPERGVERYSFR